jgi:hypothetical protein
MIPYIPFPQTNLNKKPTTKKEKENHTKHTHTHIRPT